MTVRLYNAVTVYTISIHMPHTWHDVRRSLSPCISRKFQSTCHIRGMTTDQGFMRVLFVISIHMPHTWHDGCELARRPYAFISIHMPHTWHDNEGGIYDDTAYISIHMPHTWHDGSSRVVRFSSSNFNPHATYVA